MYRRRPAALLVALTSTTLLWSAPALAGDDAPASGTEGLDGPIVLMHPPGWMDVGRLEVAALAELERGGDGALASLDARYFLHRDAFVGGRLGRAVNAGAVAMSADLHLAWSPIRAKTGIPVLDTVLFHDVFLLGGWSAVWLNQGEAAPELTSGPVYGVEVRTQMWSGVFLRLDARQHALSLLADRPSPWSVGLGVSVRLDPAPVETITQTEPF